MSNSQDSITGSPENYFESQRSDSISILTSSNSKFNCPFDKDKKAVTDCYFAVGDEEQKNEKGVSFKLGTCLCGTKVKLFVGKGVNNLYNHVVKVHQSEYVDQVNEFKRQKQCTSNNSDDVEEAKKIKVQSTLQSSRLVSDKAKTISSWLQWVTEGNLPFVFVEKDVTRKFSKLASISTTTLMKYLEVVTSEIVIDLTEEIKQVSGKIGWLLI
jgi:hypothetical protein